MFLRLADTLSRVGFLVGLLFFCVSLSPSLLLGCQSFRFSVRAGFCRWVLPGLSQLYCLAFSGTRRDSRPPPTPGNVDHAGRFWDFGCLYA